jgi:hypothetical protein
VDHVVTLERRSFFRGIVRIFRRPDEQIDEMFAPLVDERRDGAMVEIIEAAAGKRESFRGEVIHRRREIELAVEPGFYGVLVGGDYVGQVRGHQRAHMA